MRIQKVSENCGYIRVDTCLKNIKIFRIVIGEDDN